MPYVFANSILILIGILGLFVISLMLFSYRSNVFVNIYLVVIFILCSIRNIIIGFIEITDSTILLPSKYISPFFLIVVPCLFLYFKSLVKDYKHIYQKDLIHLLFPALNLALNIGQAFIPVLNNQLIEDIRFLSLIIFFLVYLILSFNVLYHGFWKQDVRKSVASRHFMLMKNWTLFILTISTFLFLRILYSIYTEKVSHELFRAHNYSFLVIIPWLLIYGKILISPEILYGYPKLKKRLTEFQNLEKISSTIWKFDSINISNIQDKKLSNNLKERVLPYVTDIENYVNKESPFRNAKFSFSEFSKALNIPSSHVNYIFKYHSEITFVEFKNFCRIKDALKLIDENYLDTLTLEGLANKVGFSSYNSFFTAFKKQTTLAPKEYLNSYKNSDLVL